MRHTLLRTALLLLSCVYAHAADAPLRPVGGDWPPVIGAWFWGDDAMEPDAYKPFLDRVAAHTPYTLLSGSLRISRGEITSALVHDQIGKGVRYANSLGLKVAFDLDIRLARRDFQSRYPEEMQEELVLKTAELPADGVATLVFEGRDLQDHMTGGTFPYTCLGTRLVRVYTFARGAEGIDPASVRDVTKTGVQATADGPRKLTVTVPAEAGRCACVMAAHAYLTPDVFAPHLLDFQRGIIRQYAEVPLAGVMKDEWGFPPDHTGNPAHDRFWYSAAMADAYAQCSDGGDLIRDALLMCSGEKGRERERLAAINRYGKLCRDRNAAIEDDFYRAGKEVFGRESFVVTHATWTPYPGAQEYRKNGLDWWAATRDIGQSDEATPYPCRTSLAKRWGYRLWYNQYYSTKTEDYLRELWADALSGGRLNVHPIYPREKMGREEADWALIRCGLTSGMSRLRMLDRITRAPLDCPAAVIFGHACAMNWAVPSYNHVGLEIAYSLCAKGYPTDLFPSSLVGSTALHIDGDGYVCLGPQRYRAVVLYQPEFGSREELDFFAQAARGKSKLFVVGEWTRDFAAQPLAGMETLGEGVGRCEDNDRCVEAACKSLDAAGIASVTGWTVPAKAWGQKSATNLAPPRSGHSVLTDGTYVRIAGERDSAGDAIQETFTWQGHTVAIDAIGMAAIRFGGDNAVAAFAAGGLKSVKTDGLTIELPERADIALIREADGSLHGVVQGFSGPIPESLSRITGEWERLDVPPLAP